LAEESSFAGGEFSISQLDKAAQDGNKNVEALLDRLARTLGLVISQLNCAFNPGKIILAGVFPAFGNPFLEKLRERFRAASRTENLPPLVISDLGEFNGAIGAAALAVHQWKPASQGP
jgi:glucokinase